MDSSDHLFRFAIGLVKDRPKAEDIVQESYARLWERRDQVEKGKEKSYLFTIAYHLAISELRQESRHPRSELNPFIGSDTPHDWQEAAQTAFMAMEALSPRARTAIMLSDWQGYSYREIAQIMELNEGQVKITIHRARQILREILKHEYEQ